MLKGIKMFAGVVRVKVARRELKHETELLSKNLGFIVTLRRYLTPSTLFYATYVAMTESYE